MITRKERLEIEARAFARANWQCFVAARSFDPGSDAHRICMELSREFGRAESRRKSAAKTGRPIKRGEPVARRTPAAPIPALPPA